MRLNGYKKKYVFLFQIIEYVCPRLPAVRSGVFYFYWIRNSNSETAEWILLEYEIEMRVLVIYINVVDVRYVTRKTPRSGSMSTVY